MFKKQIDMLIIFWRKELKDSKTYEETEEIKKILRLLRILKAEIDLSEAVENYIPRMEMEK